MLRRPSLGQILLSGLLAALVVLASSPARAQSAAGEPALVPPATSSGSGALDREDQAQRLTTQGRRMRIAGWAVLGVGLALAVVSTVAFARPDELGGASRGLLFALPAVFVGGGGVYLLFEGKDRLARARQLSAGQLVLAPAPAGALGASVGWRY